MKKTLATVLFGAALLFASQGICAIAGSSDNKASVTKDRAVNVAASENSESNTQLTTTNAKAKSGSECDTGCDHSNCSKKSHNDEKSDKSH